jgi:hypothetical protein
MYSIPAYIAMLLRLCTLLWRVLYIGGWYTIFLELPSASLRPNRLLARMSNMSGVRESVTGSILVVKQRSDKSIVNMTNCDQNTSNFLITRYVAFSCILVPSPIASSSAQCTPNSSLVTSMVTVRTHVIYTFSIVHCGCSYYKRLSQSHYTESSNIHGVLFRFE